MRDPRLEIIKRRFDYIGKVIVVSSGKGGVGKSMVATCLALNLKGEGYKVGLLDLDFTSPATHIILGAEGLYPEEEYGIIPPLVYDIRYLSLTHYSLDEPVPLRGKDISNAIIELLAITRWDDLDYLVIDMPPGISDATLDIIRLIPRLEFIIVTTSSRVAYQSVRRLIVLLNEMSLQIIGVIENMLMKSSNYVKADVETLGLEYLGAINYDEAIEASIGNITKLLMTDFYFSVGEIIHKII